MAEETLFKVEEVMDYLDITDYEFAKIVRALPAQPDIYGENHYRKSDVDTYANSRAYPTGPSSK